jgi:hypothetical protein
MLVGTYSKWEGSQCGRSGQPMCGVRVVAKLCSKRTISRSCCRDCRPTWRSISSRMILIWVQQDTDGLLLKKKHCHNESYRSYCRNARANGSTFPNSNLSPEIGCPNIYFCGFLQTIHGSAGIVSNSRLSSHPIQFIIHFSPYHLTPYYVTYCVVKHAIGEYVNK